MVVVVFVVDTEDNSSTVHTVVGGWGEKCNGNGETKDATGSNADCCATATWVSTNGLDILVVILITCSRINSSNELVESDMDVVIVLIVVVFVVVATVCGWWAAVASDTARVVSNSGNMSPGGATRASQDKSPTINTIMTHQK